MPSPNLPSIVRRALTLEERLRGIPPGAEAVLQPAVERRLGRWLENVGGKEDSRLHKRLAWDGLREADLRRALGEMPMAPSIEPGWARTLGAIVEAAKEPASPLPAETMPFSAIFAPMLEVARRRLAGRWPGAATPSPLARLSAGARLQMEGALAERLAQLSARTLDAELAGTRPPTRHLLLLLLGELPETAGRARLDAFVESLLADGLVGFFDRYPVLGRLLATAVDFWVESMGEFLERLEADAPELARQFGPPGSGAGDFEARVERLETSLSDPHHRGRSVLAVTFASGMKVVYKPRDLGLEESYNHLLRWLNPGLPAAPFRVLRVLARPSYGWVEHVSSRPCQSAEEARRFYRGAGQTLALLYVLGCNDCHHENLVASGDQLVLVDAETLLQPEESQPADPDATLDEAGERLRDSVLCTGLLPRWHFSRDGGVAYDLSALGGIGAQRAPREALRWRSAGTDDLHLARVTALLPAAANAALLGGSALSPNDYVEDLDAGFEAMYRLLCDRREALLAPDGPLTAWSQRSLRFVFRATQTYALLLEETLVPACLGDAADRGLELEVLYRTFLEGADRPLAWPIPRAECRALEQLDIPYFGARADSDALTLGLDEPIAGYFNASGYDRMVARLCRLDDEDLARQRMILAGALRSRVARPHAGTRRPASAGTGPAEVKAAAPADLPSLSSARLLAEAEALGHEICARAILSKDGAASWIGLEFIPAAERLQLQILDDGLYSGNGGIALFLAALDKVRGRRDFHSVALGAFTRLRLALSSSRPESLRRMARRYGISGATGLASIVYALVRCGDFLGVPELLEDASRVAALITSDLVAADRQLDIVGGAAGAILGLLALHAATGERGPLATALCCGRRLLSQRIPPGPTPRAWRTIGPVPLTGFGHGAAGIAYALLKLFAVSGDERFRQAALEGLAYERHVFRPDLRNWPDLREFADQAGEPGFRLGWCHGATGIGLGRLGAASILGGTEVADDLEAALAAVLADSELKEVDHLCCGNLAPVELLLLSAHRLYRADLHAAAENRLARVLARKAENGYCRSFASLEGAVFEAGFFQGAAGIGYTLLRAGGASALPSVLLWE